MKKQYIIPATSLTALHGNTVLNSTSTPMVNGTTNDQWVREEEEDGPAWGEIVW